MLQLFDSSTTLELYEGGPAADAPRRRLVHDHRPAPHAVARPRLCARRRRDRPGAVRVWHALAAVYDLPRAVGLLARRPHARLRDLRLRSAGHAAARRPRI